MKNLLFFYSILISLHFQASASEHKFSRTDNRAPKSSLGKRNRELPHEEVPTDMEQNNTSLNAIKNHFLQKYDATIAAFIAENSKKSGTAKFLSTKYKKSIGATITLNMHRGNQVLSLTEHYSPLAVQNLIEAAHLCGDFHALTLNDSRLKE